MSAVEIGSVEREKGRNEGRFGASGRINENSNSPLNRVSAYGGLGSTPERLPEEEEEPVMHAEKHAYSEVEEGSKGGAKDPLVARDSNHLGKEENSGVLIKNNEEPAEELEEEEEKSHEGEEVEYEEDFVEEGEKSD